MLPEQLLNKSMRRYQRRKHSGEKMTEEKKQNKPWQWLWAPARSRCSQRSSSKSCFRASAVLCSKENNCEKERNHVINPKLGDWLCRFRTFLVKFRAKSKDLNPQLGDWLCRFCAFLVKFLATSYALNTKLGDWEDRQDPERKKPASTEKLQKV